MLGRLAAVYLRSAVCGTLMCGGRDMLGRLYTEPLMYLVYKPPGTSSAGLDAIGAVIRGRGN